MSENRIHAHELIDVSWWIVKNVLADMKLPLNLYIRGKMVTQNVETVGEKMVLTIENADYRGVDSHLSLWYTGEHR